MTARLKADVRDDAMIRKYQRGDEQYIAQIYHDAIYQLAAGDYTREQLDAWADPPVDLERARQRCETKQPFVNVRDGRVVGFMELDPNGHIDCAFVDPACARMGIMSEIMEEVKNEATRAGMTKLFAEVSKTARPFFEHHGFVWVRDNILNVRGASLENCIMECRIKAEPGAANRRR